jgi:SAM-dependent methyltransferase
LELATYIPKPKRVIDCGAGYGKWGFLFTRAFRMSQRPELIAVDIWPVYVRDLRNIADHALIASSSALPFRDGSFELGFLCEVIEHLDQRDGELSIREMQRVCQKCIVSTPKRMFPQDTYDGNPFQAHRHQWSPEDLAGLGLNVFNNHAYSIATNIPLPSKPRLRRRLIPLRLRKMLLAFLKPGKQDRASLPPSSGYT